MQPPPRPIVVVDVGALAADACTVESLARLRLIARRFGASIELRNAPAELVDLIALIGLSDLLPVSGESTLQVDRQSEEREQVLVDEEVDPRDLTS